MGLAGSILRCDPGHDYHSARVPEIIEAFMVHTIFTLAYINLRPGVLQDYKHGCELFPSSNSISHPYIHMYSYKPTDPSKCTILIFI